MPIPEHHRLAVPGLPTRPITPQDMRGLQAFHGRLSDDTIRNRYFGAHPELADDEATKYTSIDPAAEAAFVAVAGDEIIAVGRYIRVPDGDLAEVAFVVEDSYQRRGLGTRLLCRLADAAWNAGIRGFVADTLASNHGMLDVFMSTPQAVTLRSTRRDGSVVHLVMSVTEPRQRTGQFPAAVRLS